MTIASPPKPHAMPALSVIVITRNEAANIEACLASVAFADEWIVVDAGSTDDTAALATARGATVTVAIDWPGFGIQKQRALDQAKGRWVLAIDADERVSPELAAEIRGVVATSTSETAPATEASPTRAGYELSRLSSFCGQWMRHGDWYPDRVLRLFRREAGRFSTDLVHERLIVEGPVGSLGGDLLHDTMPTLEDALDKMNRYTTGRAADKVRAGARGGLGPALLHGSWAFIRCYVMKRGFLDGSAGFVLAAYVAEGTYYRYLKIGHLQRLPAVQAQ